MRTALVSVSPPPRAPLTLCSPPKVVDVVRTSVTRREFERAVMPCVAGLRARALRLAKNPADADDLLQETLLRAWRFWPRYRDQDHCRAWLQRIMGNTFCSNCRSAARRRAQLAQLALERAVDDELDHAAAREAQVGGDAEHVGDDRLASSLAALKPEQREILCLIDVNQRSYREAASALDCPIGTVMSRLHRARAALRTQLLAAPPVCLT